MNRTLILLRHGQSEWNLKNLFTGWRDPDLTPQGIQEAHGAGEKLREEGLSIDVAFSSALLRAQRTLDLALSHLSQHPKIFKHEALNERDYGELSGLNKHEASERWGEEQIRIWRRSYYIPPPGGESLRDTLARVLPYYCEEILPQVLSGRTTLVCAHGNSLRSLIMVLERLNPLTIQDIEIGTGIPILYQLGPDSHIRSKRVLTGKTSP